MRPDSSLAVGLIPSHGPDHVDVMIRQADRARDLGFDSIWVEEHHAAGPYWPDPFLPLAILAAGVRGLTLGTDITVLPLHDPVEVAERAALIDSMTGGKFVLGVGLGDSATEFSMFRVDPSTRGARFEEQLRIIRALWTEESVTFHGRHFSLNDARLSPRPPLGKCPPIWVGGWGPRQLKRAARFGDAWLPGPVATVAEVVARRDAYGRELRSAKRIGTDVPLTRDVVIADTDTQAWALAERWVAEAYTADYVASDHPIVGGQRRPAGVFHQLAADRLIVGGPSSVTAQLLRAVELVGATHLILRLKPPGVPPEITSQMIEILGAKVLHTLRARGAVRV